MDEGSKLKAERRQRAMPASRAQETTVIVFVERARASWGHFEASKWTQPALGKPSSTVADQSEVSAKLR